VWWLGYVLVLGCLAVYGLHRIYLTFCYWRRPATTGDVHSLPDVLPAVTVQLPVFNEMYVAERLIDAVAKLDWPADKLQIQVLDDSTDETTELCRARVEFWRERGLDAVHLHRSDRTGFKAGALEAGLATATGELVLVLDADFLPPEDLLRKSVGHFQDADVGMVQVRWEHLNRDYSALTKVQALLLDGHFVIEQHTRAAGGLFFNFNGTAGIWRRQAIVDAGGWQHDTLTEDLDLSYRAALAGWRFVYLLGTAAPAELPACMNGFKSQQFRWAKGSIQVARKLLPRVWRADLSLRVKLESFFHLTQNVPYLLTLLLVLLCVPPLLFENGGALASPWLALALAFGTTGTLAVYCVTSQRVLARESAVRTLLRLPMLMAVTAGICVNQARAVLEGGLGFESEFVRTPKYGITQPRQRWRALRYRGVKTLVPFAELLLAVYFATAVAYALETQQFVAVPILGIFSFGFSYVGVLSLR